MKQIVCLSTTPWFPIPTRKQQVMSRIKDADILYFDPSVTYIAPLKDKSAKEKLTKYRQKGENVQNNITVYSLPPVLPFFNRFRIINKINQKRMASYINKKIKEHGFNKPIVWTYSPTACDCVDYIDKSALVYDCVDRHSAYGGQMNPEVVDNMEMDLARKADSVFATAQSLCERLKKANPTAKFIPNGANYERFSQSAKPQPIPSELKDIKKPIFGFVGALQSCISYNYIEYAAKERKDWSFVLIGRKLPDVDLTNLGKLPNVHFLGLKPNEQLPKYIAQFDACLNLFVSNQLSKDVSPLKFYEYLATGKPIVSTPQPEQVLKYKFLIHIANDEKEFIKMCEEALSDNSSERNLARMNEGKLSSWDARVEEMTNYLKQQGLF